MLDFGCRTGASTTRQDLTGKNVIGGGPGDSPCHKTVSCWWNLAVVRDCPDWIMAVRSVIREDSPMHRRRFLERTALVSGATVLSGLLPRSGRSGWTVPTGEVPPTPAKGPLRVLSSNPRYFTDGSGKAVYLAGSHNWHNFQDNGHRFLEGQDRPPVFDYKAYLDFLQSLNHNFFRLWRWESPKWADEEPVGVVKYCQPHPWVRSGPGAATDGKPRFDLTKFNPEYFDRMRAW